jgi:serine/threonine protein kinase
VILYELTTGTLPFRQNDREQLKRAVVKGTYPEPDHLSANLVDLLRRMLTVDPNHRATLAEVMRHRYVQGVNSSVQGVNRGGQGVNPSVQGVNP